MRRLIVWIVFLVACGKSKAECEAEAADVMTFLRSFDHSGSFFQVDAKLVTRAGLPAAKEIAPVVLVAAKDTNYRGRLVDQAALVEALVETQQRIREDIERGRVPRRNPPDPRLLYFQITGDASWERVVAAVQAGADAGFTRASFVFLAPADTAKLPRRTWVDDNFETAPPGGKLAATMGEVIARCPALEENFRRVGSDEGGDKAELLVQGIGPAMIECNCKVDVPALRTILWRILGNPNPTGVLDLAIEKGAPAIALPAAMSWGEASKKLVAGKASLAVR